MGNIMEILDRSEMMIHKGIEEINQKGELNASSLELLGNAVDALKDITEIRDMMGGGYERYSADGYGRRRRDSMGRFMDDGYGRRYYDGGYRDDYRDGGYGEHYGDRGYADDKREERERIERKMRNAQNEQEREMYRRMLEKM